MRIRPALISALALCLLIIPYVIATQVAGPDDHFTGFLLNPQDGFSYLAKMRQGYDGSWRFQLPFSADPGPAVPVLFIFYIWLGHVARLTGLSLALTFHLARGLSSILLLWSMWRLVQTYAACFDRTHPGAFPRLWVYGMLAMGLGMGWLALPFGRLLSDSWVVEAFPFLSMFTTPHFALGLALLIFIILLPLQEVRPRHFLLAALLAALLGLIQPFGVVVCLAALGAWLALELIVIWRSTGLRRLAPMLDPRQWPGRLFGLAACVGLGGLPWLVYDQIVASTHAQLSLWNAQNLTWTPPAWDVALSLSPALILAVWGVRDSFRQDRPLFRLAPAWLIISLALIYIPFDLQRRFMTGIYVPTVFLAGHALGVWQAARPRLFLRLRLLVAALAAPTLLLILALAVFGSLSHEPAYYLSGDEARAMLWIEGNTPPHALILAAPETGLLIPGLTGRRVIYGHPFETINAEQEQAAVERFFSLSSVSGSDLAQSGRDFLQQRQVDYIFYGPREQALGPLLAGLNLRPVFTSGGVTVYQP